jgi:hypothetical protein
MKAYGERRLTNLSPAQSFTEPLTVADVKTFLRINYAVEDSLLATMITAARVVAEIEQHVDLVAKQYDLNLDLLLGYDSIAGAAYPLRFNSIYNLGAGYEIYLAYPLISVDLFEYTDNLGNVTVLNPGINADYIVDTARALVIPPWGKIWPFFQPQPTSAVLVRYTSGYTNAHPFWQNNGKGVLMGMMMLIAAWFQNRVPFDPALRGNVAEYPYAVTQMLGYGARPRAH